MRRRWTIATAACVAAALQGCSGGAQQIADASRRSGNGNSEPARAYLEYSTGEVHSNAAGGIGAKRLIARVDRKTGATTALLQLEIAYAGSVRRGYETARSDRTGQLPLTVVQRDSRCQPPQPGCTQFERMLIALPEAELRSSGGTFALTVVARNGPELRVEVPKAMSNGLFGKIDEDRARGRTAVRADAIVRGARS